MLLVPAPPSSDFRKSVLFLLGFRLRAAHFVTMCGLPARQARHGLASFDRGESGT